MQRAACRVVCHGTPLARASNETGLNQTTVGLTVTPVTHTAVYSVGLQLAV